MITDYSHLYNNILPTRSQADRIPFPVLPNSLRAMYLSVFLCWKVVDSIRTFPRKDEIEVQVQPRSGQNGMLYDFLALQGMYSLMVGASLTGDLASDNNDAAEDDVRGTFSLVD